MLKVSVIGGGSTYTPELLQGFIDRQDVFPIDELWLMDIDERRLEIVGKFSQRMAAANNAHFSVHLSTNQQESVAESAYVITQLRVGKMAARREDEYLGKRHGLIGQETTGVGGMAKALRTIPVILDIAEDIRLHAPDALLVNFANPSGLVTETLTRYAPSVSSVGVCNATITTKMEILNLLNAHLNTAFSAEDAKIKALGLNHLTWFYGLDIKGEDYWPQVMEILINGEKPIDDLYFDNETLRILKMLPNSYLRYFYYTEKMLEKQSSWPPSRAEEIYPIEEELLKQYQEIDRTEPPEDLILRGGAFYSTVATQLLNAHYNDLDEIHVVNVRHDGAICGWPAEWVLELPCRVNSSGIEPLPDSPLPLVCESLISRVKAYEILTSHAAVTGDRSSAYQALLAHPLGPPADQISTFLKDMLEVNHQYLPRFFK